MRNCDFDNDNREKTRHRFILRNIAVVISLSLHILKIIITVGFVRFWPIPLAYLSGSETSIFHNLTYN